MVYRTALFLGFIIVRMLPGFGQAQPFNFLVLTDTQLGMHAADKNFAQEAASYEFAVASINRLKPEFVVVLGDLVNKAGDMEQTREFLRISRTIDPFIPVYYVAGNHDVGPAPNPETLAAYRKNVGLDYYSFRAGPVYGIVLNSNLIIEPKNAMAESEQQDSWLRKELETAKASGAPHIMVFQHHPYFLKDSQEPAQWGNIPLDRRQSMLELLYRYGVRYIFAGHVHQNSAGKYRELEAVATGPIAMPFGEEGSGIRAVAVTGSDVQHRYYEFGRMPNKLADK